MLGDHGALVDAPRAAGQGATVFAQPPDEILARPSRQVADGADAQRGQLFPRLRPDAPELRHGQRCQKGRLLAGRDDGDGHGRAVAFDPGLAHVVGRFCQQLVTRHPQGAREMVLFPDLLLELPRQHFARCLEIADV